MSLIHAQVGEISQRFDMPTELVESSLTHRISSGLIQAQARPGKFYTHNFVQMQRSKIRGLLAGATSPMSMSHLIQTYRFEKEILVSTLDDLINEGRLPGAVTGNSRERATFTPAIFVRGQRSGVESFYKQNGYVEYSRLKKVGIHDPVKHIQQNTDWDCQLLDTCAVSANTMEMIEVSIQEAVQHGGSIRISYFAPSCLSPGDFYQLTRRIKALNTGRSVVLKDDFVVATALIDQLKTKVSAEVTDHISKEATVMSRSSSTLSTTSKPPAAAEHKPKKKHRKGKRRGQASSDDEPEPEPVVAASSKLDKKARRADKRATKAGKKALSGGAAEDDGQASDENPFDPARFRELLPAWLQEMDCEEDDEELVALLAELLVPFAGEELARLKESIWSGSVTARRKRQELFVKAFEAAVAQLHLYNKGFAAAGGEVEALELALVKEIGGQLQNEVVLNAAYHAGMDEAEKIESSRELTVQSRQRILRALPKESQKALTPLSEAKTGEDLLAACYSVSDVCDVYLKPSDKKTERSVVHSRTKELEEELGQQLNVLDGLVLAVQLLHVRQTKTLLFVNTKCVFEAVTSVSALEGLGEELVEALKLVRASVQTYLDLADDSEIKQSTATEMEASFATLTSKIMTRNEKK
eukprot:TRINITY_DN9123_c0_g1_i5.p1 TRINITY_DN9123_c0_g1~~TRINITY_DN9123_c0_g1_i5.p1  ORF type:complete len:642 (-),score=191.27 TRINITY_DN9123_c0_g1_i5:218-2143(-)